MYWTAIIITAVLLAGYCLLILVYRKWYLQLPVFTTDLSVPASRFFSVIIPARDEEIQLRSCLLSVLEQDYPAALFEVIVINDHSTDRTEAIIREMQTGHPNLVLINLADHLRKEVNSYKKKAIELAIGQSKGDWIVTTDADCTVNKNWLKLVDGFIREKQPVFIAAPVMFTNNGRFLSVFQLLDFISLQGITAASVSAGYHTMCNGANIAYEKQAFYEVDGFRGIDQLASGDDMLLMHKIKQKYPGRLGYLFHPDATVTTPPMETWNGFLNQRIRWASKAGSYRDRSIFRVLFLVYAVNLMLLVLPVAALFTENVFASWLILIIAKILVELCFMFPVARFFRQEHTLAWFPFMQPFHIVYTVIAGWLGKFGTYQWKGRKVR